MYIRPKERCALMFDSQLHCARCEDLRQAALDASRVYHNLLAVLEAAHICHNTDLTFDIRQQVGRALTNRDDAIRVLSEHERSHAKERQAPGMVIRPRRRIPLDPAAAS